jgi:UDP-N-acetylglucosamine:LPS N-acetylglucosamine transferase
MKKVLFISGSLGLGHVSRDLAIASAMRARCPGLDISWLAASPADRVIREAGERLLPDAADFANESAIAEQSVRGTDMNLVRYVFSARKPWLHNIEVFARVTGRERFDLVIGDETYEISLAYKRKPRLKTCPLVMIFDFVGIDSMSRNPLEKLGVYFLNWAWSGGRITSKSPYDLALFIGEPEDVPDRSFGFMLPNRRDWAREHYRFVGHVFPFDPARYTDLAAIKSRLGYGKEPLVICSIGGTAVGRELLDLCGAAFPIARREIPDLRMVLVGGPRISKDKLTACEGVEIRGYVPVLYEHFAAADLAIVQAGGTTTLELTALRRPFIYFPLEGHSEQQVSVAGRLARHGAGVRMNLSQTTAHHLSTAILANIGKQAMYPPIATDGALKAAELICGLFQERIQPH